MSVVGFDFGYQSCYIAVARQGGIETVTNDYSDRSTPVVVSLCEKNRAIGTSAKNMIMSNLKNTVWGHKRLIGRKFSDPVVQQEKATLPYAVVSGPDDSTAIQVMYLNEKETFSPEQITAMVFTKLKECAEIALKTKVVDVVISTPCYFTDVQRRALLDSAKMSGLNCLRLLNDTTATALAYGIYKQDLPAVEENPRNVIFVDIGHSDTQISACSFNKGKLKVLATASDDNLGGRDFDRVIRDYFVEDFKKRYKVDASTQPRPLIRLSNECEKLKKNMSSTASNMTVNIECFMDDKDVTGKMNRETFEELSAPLLKRIEETMVSLLDHGMLKPDDIYAVEIVGGATRTPAIKQLVTKVYGKEPSTTLNADEAVSRGCALQCAILSPTFRVRDFSITDCQPYPITLSWQSTLDEDSNMEVFSRFHAVPFSKMLTFYRSEAFTLDAKYSNINDIPYNSVNIGSFAVNKVTPQASGESSKVKVKVRVNIHGLFTVSSASLVEKVEPKEEETKDEPMDVEGDENAANDTASNTTPTTNDTNGPTTTNSTDADMSVDPPTENNTEEAKTETPKEADVEAETKTDPKEKKETAKKAKVKLIDLPIEAQVFSLETNKMNKFHEQEMQMIANDRLEKERANAKNAVEEYVYEMRDKLYTEYEPYVKEDDRAKFVSLLEETENWLYDDGEDQNKNVYVKKLELLKKSGDPIVMRCNEHKVRPAAFEQYGTSLQRFRKVTDAYANKDEKYIHIEAEEMKKLDKHLTEKTTWYETKLNITSKQSLYDTPLVYASQIYQTRIELENFCNPIVNKPKPKPKEEPPKEQPKEEEKPKTETPAQPNDKQSTEQSNGEQQPPSTEEKPEMELD